MCSCKLISVSCCKERNGGQIMKVEELETMIIENTNNSEDISAFEVDTIEDIIVGGLGNIFIIYAGDTGGWNHGPGMER